MRRSAAAAATTIALAGIIASVALAKGGVQVKVPAPAVGKASLQLVTIKVKGHNSGRPTLKLTNAAALGQGFGGVVALGGKKPSGGTTVWDAYILMYMGNLSTSPASTANIQVTAPAGDVETVSKPKDESTNCAVATKLGVGKHEMAYAHWFLERLGEAGSSFTKFIENVVPALCP
jgi:hypothetical protein